MADNNNISLDQLIQEGKLARSENQRASAIDLLNTFLAVVGEAGENSGSDPTTFIVKKMDEMDGQLSTHLTQVLQHPDLKALEASWRGLHYLVYNTETGSRLKLRLLNTTKEEISKDLERAVEFDQSHLFKKVYEEEYGTFGGYPYSCLIGDFYFGRDPMDIELLENISHVAAAAHAPFIAAASPELFDLDSFGHLSKPRDLTKIFESTELVKWRSFRETEDSRYVALTLPHVLVRLPYGSHTVPVEGFRFEEQVDGVDNTNFCWGNPAYALGQRITNAFSLYGWTAAIRGVEGGGLVEDLPTYTFKSQEGDVLLKCPTEVAITDRREKELSDLGLIALCHCKGTDYAAFFGGQTTQKAKIYDSDEANANAALSTRLPYILAASRFAHYIKVMMRDKIGSFVSRSEVSLYLNNWIANYVLLNDDASQDIKAKYPLREARVDVIDIPGKPGSYRATIFLRPHFQMEELTASIRLVATLPTPAGS